MLITIDTDKDHSERIRSLIGFLVHLYNLDTDEPEVPEGTTAEILTVQLVHPEKAAEAYAARLPTPPSNVINFPVPPPPAFTASPAVPTPSADIAGDYAPNSLAAAIAAAAPSAAFVPAEYDSAGMPWDARIHQKAKGKKKDLTWKLIKGVDMALVQLITTELAARKIATPQSPTLPPAVTRTADVGLITGVPFASVPPPPSVVGAVPPPPATVAPQVSLPDANNAGQQNSVPVPPVPSTASAEIVSAPATSATGIVPVPPVAAAGIMGGITYRTIVDKATEGTRKQKLTAQQFIAMVLASGCPNLQQLNQMPSVWADVDARLDMALAGLT